jgi:hypothetical protein
MVVETSESFYIVQYKLQMAYNLRTGLTGSGDIDVNVSLDNLNASNITAGVFTTDRIPTLGDAKLSDLNAAKLTGTIVSDRIPLV